MDINPYESPRAEGYAPPRPKSKLMDFLQLFGCALAVHIIIQALTWYFVVYRKLD
jgi:hypothetical protein